MGVLDGFLGKALIEKILLLDELEKGCRVEAIPELLKLYRERGFDEAVHSAVSDTLRALLARDEEATVRGLDAEDPRTRRMCIQVASQNRFASATPALLALARRETDPDILTQILAALRRRPASETVEIYRHYMGHPDPLLSALSIEMLGVLRDEESVPRMCAAIEATDDDDTGEGCQITTENAIRALGAFGTEAAITFLVSRIHHRNPTVRRILHHELVRLGTKVVPRLADAFETGNVDRKILSANLLGLIGDRGGADVLVAALDGGRADNSNVRFAVYEALGSIPSLKGLVCLSDGLAEADPMVLMAVVSSLDHQINPGVSTKLLRIMEEGGEQAERLAQAIAAARATGMFEVLYPDESAAQRVLDWVLGSKDPQILEAFRSTLEKLGGERAEAYAAKLAAVELKALGKRILAVDDSRSMLLFYRSVGSEMEFDVRTAGNGKEALSLLESGESFDLVITDLNMPEMDGMELCRKIRSNLFLQHLPIIMATTESERSQRELAEKAGVNGFLPKPLKPDELQRVLCDHLSRVEELALSA